MEYKTKNWVGVDFDQTLCENLGGEPVPAMMKVVRGFLDQGIEVRIFTARACDPDTKLSVEKWLKKHGLPALKVTNQKDWDTMLILDDRARQVIANEGRIVEDK